MRPAEAFAMLAELNLLGSETAIIEDEILIEMGFRKTELMVSSSSLSEKEALTMPKQKPNRHDRQLYSEQKESKKGRNRGSKSFSNEGGLKKKSH